MKKSARNAIQCTAITGEVGTFLYYPDPPKPNSECQLASPVFPGCIELFAWCKANGWQSVPGSYFLWEWEAPDYSYLKPAIAAQMPAAVEWFAGLNGRERLAEIEELGLNARGQLPIGWRDVVIEARAWALAYPEAQQSAEGGAQ